MSLKFKFDQLGDNKNQEGDSARSEDIERYESEAQTRALTLIDTSGNHYFLNYSYLVSGEYKPNESVITLFFTSHTVTIKGTNLESLFEELLSNAIKKIACTDKRYASTKAEGEVFVSEMSVAPV